MLFRSVLARYAKSYDVPIAQWTFATGALAEIQRLGAPFGLQFTGTGAQLTHNLRTVVIDPQGRVRRVFEGNRWNAAFQSDHFKAPAARASTAYCRNSPARPS